MRRILLPVVMTLALTAQGCAGGKAAPRAPARETKQSSIKTVFLIVMENHNWSDIKGNPDARYLNRTLLPKASHAERYYNPPANHPSLPNYLWLEGGTSFGIHDDRLPADGQQSTHLHLTALLDRAKVSWRAYEEGISGSGCPLNTAGFYAPRHNPFVYFRDVSGRAAYCRAHERPYRELPGDLARNRVARYNFITPNVCDDMHDSCPPVSNPVRQGDTWLAHAVPQILRSRAYKQGGVLFITWDEGEGSDGPIGMIVLSPRARGHGYADAHHYTHSSTLRTLQEIFRVHPFLSDAAHARDLRPLFTQFP